MTFNAAVFDVHPGDRRQMERILGKEKEARASSGVTLYSESFGSTGSLLVYPMKHDIFFIDAADSAVSTDGSINIETAREIRAAGVVAPIVLFYREDIDMPPLPDDLENVVTFKKPITTAFVRSVLDKRTAEKATLPVRYEIRGGKETYYVYDYEIMYALPAGRFTDVYLTEGRKVHVMESLKGFGGQFEKKKSLKLIGSGFVINLEHITSAFLCIFIMTDGRKLFCPPLHFIYYCILRKRMKKQKTES
ncbi:MAG: hypothetical protein IKR68_00470 [Lachnospiraceae bacterium]|nr:hypothetical protein [Lachnospiraceae bacterium]